MPPIFQRLLPPALAAGALLMLDWKLVPDVPAGEQWKQFGILLPALWLAGVGGRGLLERGGFLMRCFGYPPKEATADKESALRVACTKVALLWAFLGLCSGAVVYLLPSEWVKGDVRPASIGQYAAGIVVALFYSGMMACLSVFILLAGTRESTSGINQTNEEIR